MQAIILAGGLGTRLRTLVNDRPKPMAIVEENKPFLEYQIELLKKVGVEEIVLCVGYQRNKIEAYFKDGQHWKVSIRYAVEERLLGTGGAVKNAEKFIDAPFLVLNGDSFLDLDLSDFLAFHKSIKVGNTKVVGSIALAEVHDRRKYGTVILDDTGNIMKFLEKSLREKMHGMINAGIYLFELPLFQQIPANTKISLEREVFPQLLKDGFQLVGFPSQRFFVDIGTPEGYYCFQNYIKDKDGVK